MVTKYIKNYKLVNDEIPIMSLDFDNIPDFSEMYQEKNLQRQNYGDLSVEQGRFTISQEFHSKSFIKWKQDFYESLEFISLTLLKADPIRYPFNKDHREWFKERITAKHNWYVGPVLDRPGFFMPFHLDNRFMIISGVINLDYTETSTIFQKDSTGWGLGDFVGDPANIIHTGKKDKHSGTFWLNTESTWHAVPKVSADRKILLFNVFF